MKHVDGERSIGSSYEIDEGQAPWVRWIFERYAEGMSCRAIAYELNRQSVPSPRGGTWCLSAIYGSPKKGSGVLNNVLYVGRYIWNRSQWTKDPDTNARQRIDRPATEWHEHKVPELRLVDDALWQRVRTRIDSGRDSEGRKAQHRPPSALFSGLIRCPNCEGSLTVVDATYYGCGRAKDRGPTVCKGFRLRRSTVDEKLSAALRVDLLSPAAAKEFAESLAYEIEAQSCSSQATSNVLRERLRKATADVERLVDAIAVGGHSAALLSRLKTAEQESETLRTALTTEPKKRRELPIPTFDEVLARLDEVLRIDAAGARRLIAELLGKVVIEQRDDEVWAHIATDRLWNLAAGQPLTDNVVAGTRTHRYLQVRLA